jgi:hypothetical protein
MGGSALKTRRRTGPSAHGNYRGNCVAGACVALRTPLDASRSICVCSVQRVCNVYTASVLLFGQYVEHHLL